MIRDHFLCIAFFFLLVVPHSAYAQIAPKTDSLKSLLQEHSGEQRADVLLKLSEELRRSNIDSAITSARQALDISKRIENESLQAKSLNNLGWLLTNKGKYPEALKHLLQAKRIFEQMGNLQKEALASQNLGTLYRSQSDYSSALEYYFSALNLEEQLDNKDRIVNILWSIGSLYRQMDQPTKSIMIYKRGLRLSEQANNASDIAITATDLGSVYADMDSIKQAVEFYNKALNAAEKLPGAHAKATILMNLSSVYNDNNSYQKALEVNNRALTLARDMSDKMLESWALGNIAITYRGMGDYSQSNSYLLEAIPLLKEIGWQQNLINNQNRLAQNYFDSDEVEKSIVMWNQAYETASEAELIRNAFIAGLILIFIIGLLIYNRQRLKIKKNQTDLENTHLKEQQLKQDVELKNKQLTTHSLNLVQKNEMMKELKQNIKQIQQESNGDIQKELSSLEHLVDYSFNLDEDWEEFKLYFEEVHTGFLIAFWSTPLMTLGHLVFSLGMTIYILVRVYFEEKTMAREFGDDYKDYRSRVPKFFPILKRNK